MTEIYGIKNCDTMKKALSWLEAGGVAFTFHDYKKEGVPKELISRAINDCGWEEVINRRGTTWRKLDDNTKNSMDAGKALEIACENASIIKRPLIVKDDQLHFGFDEAAYQKLFG